MHPRRRSPLVTSLVALIATTGRAPASAGRLILVPGVGHFAGAARPEPTGLLEALRAWVEDGKVPGTLLARRRGEAGAITRSRPVCPDPLVAKFKGRGSTDEAADFECRTGF